MQHPQKNTDIGQENKLFAKLELKKTQVEEWLKKSVESGKVKKLNKPVRYEFDHSVE